MRCCAGASQSGGCFEFPRNPATSRVRSRPTGVDVVALVVVLPMMHSRHRGPYFPWVPSSQLPQRSREMSHFN